MKRSVVHFTTVHPRGDTRIRVKEVPALAGGLERSVVLYVQDGEGDAQEVNRISVADTGRCEGGRLGRMTQGTWRMYRALRRARPQVAHFHDPELIPVGLALQLSGVRVVYDVHEDVPRQILSKHWIPAFVRRPVSWVAEAAEWLAVRAFDGVVAATPTIAGRFPEHKTATVQNFPILSEVLSPEPMPYAERPADFAYVGGISGIRGAREMVEAIDRLGYGAARLQMAGGFQPDQLRQELGELRGWSQVCYHGWVSRPKVAQLLGRVRAGLVVLHPTMNYPDAYPVKMFEYMAAGLPVIASDFPLWRRIVDGAGCGLLVDPLDPSAIAKAMQWMRDHPAEAEAMGQRAREAVEATYNWEPESRKLVGLYERLFAK